jgi:hypothetical protein
MLGDIEVQDASTAVADEEEAIEHAKGDRWHGEEVHGRNRFTVVSKEGEPAFGWLGISRRPFHPTRDRSLAEIKTEHKKLAVDARRSPGWILNNHPEDQLSNFLGRRLPPNPRPDSRGQFPVQAKTSPVPANYGFRRDDDKSLFPSRPESANGHPEQFCRKGSGTGVDGAASTRQVVGVMQDSRGEDFVARERSEPAFRGTGR